MIFVFSELQNVSKVALSDFDDICKDSKKNICHYLKKNFSSKLHKLLRDVKYERRMGTCTHHCMQLTC